MVRDQFGAGVADLVAGHHPHYSGSTYGAASPVQQSIIEADIWDALREARSYKDIASVDLSRTILVRDNGVSESAADWWVTIGDDLASDLKFYFFVRN